MSGVQPTSAPAARCVLWHPPGSPPPKDLIDALERRRLAWFATDRIFAALTQTLSRPATGPTAPSSPTVLVLIDPPKLRFLAELLDVVARYRPRTTLWVFDLSDPSRLRSMQALEVLARYVPARVEDSKTTRAAAPPAAPPPPDTAPRADSGSGGYSSRWRLHVSEPAPADLGDSKSLTPNAPPPSAPRAPAPAVSKSELNALISPFNTVEVGFRSASS